MAGLLLIPAGLLLDRLLGEPRRFHPLIGFGRLAQRVERRLNDYSRRRGFLAWVLVVAPFTLVAAWLESLPIVGTALSLALLYLALGGRSLAEHAERVADALEADDLARARHLVGGLVSRETVNMSEAQVSRAAAESVLENGNDAVFGALFWFLLAGAPGVVLYRLANTLDAMWGYRTARYLHFGWAAARIDDVLNYVPARLTAGGYALVGATGNAVACWRRQSAAWESPNAGPVMAAGAGALNLRLGGPAFYHGAMKERPPLGQGAAPVAKDIRRAVALVRRATWLWAMLAVTGSMIGYVL